MEDNANMSLEKALEEYKIYKQIENDYCENINNCEKELLNLGINVRISENEYKPLSLVIEELSEKWSFLTDTRGQIIKQWICEQIAGIKNINFLLMIIEKLHKKQ